jgi:cytochrome c553
MRSEIRLGISAVAFWQFAAFLLLILLVWANGMLDLPHLLFGTEMSSMDFFECSLLTVGVIITALITVGHTYLRQRKITESLVTVCSSCHKVRANQEAWSAVEDYVTEHSDIQFSHGLCPECFRKSMKELQSN